MPTSHRKFTGRKFLLQLGDSSVPIVYTTVGTMRTTGLTINNEPIDVTDKDGPSDGGDPWRELIEGGLRSAELSLAGVVSDRQTCIDIENGALNGQIRDFKLVSARGDYYTGRFLIQSFERNGEYNGAEMYTAKLASAGVIAHVNATP